MAGLPTTRMSSANSICGALASRERRQHPSVQVPPGRVLGPSLLTARVDLPSCSRFKCRVHFHLNSLQLLSLSLIFFWYGHFFCVLADFSQSSTMRLAALRRISRIECMFVSHHLRRVRCLGRWLTFLTLPLFYNFIYVCITRYHYFTIVISINNSKFLRTWNKWYANHSFLLNSIL